MNGSQTQTNELDTDNTIIITCSVVGGLLVLGVIIAVIIIFKKRKEKAEQEEKEEAAKENNEKEKNKENDKNESKIDIELNQLNSSKIKDITILNTKLNEASNRSHQSKLIRKLNYKLTKLF